MKKSSQVKRMRVQKKRKQAVLLNRANRVSFLKKVTSEQKPEKREGGI